MASIEKLSSGSYRVKIRSNGVNEGKTFKTLEEAEHFKLRRESEILALKSNQVAKNIQAIRLDKLCSLYLSSSAFLKKKQSTQKTELVKSKQIVKEFGNYPISQINSNMIQDYFDRRALEPSFSNGKIRNLKVSATTIRLEKAFLSSLFAFAHARKHLASNPMLHQKFDIVKTAQVKTRITEDLRRRLDNQVLTSKNQTFKNWYLFCIETGSRPGEATRLLTKWFNPNTARISVPPDELKNNRAKTIIKTEISAQALQAQYRLAIQMQSDYLFFSKSSKGSYKPFEYSTPWRNAKIKAGLKDLKLNPHMLRHTFLSNLVEKTNFTPQVLASLAGHTSPASLNTYMHLRTHLFEAEVEEVSKSVQKDIIEDFIREVVERFKKAKPNASQEEIDTFILNTRLTIER